MIPGETYENSDRIKVYVLEVRKDNKGPAGARVPHASSSGQAPV